MTEQEFEKLWGNLVERSHGNVAMPLSRPERMFYAVNLLRGSVPRSGFLGYFENFSSGEIIDAHHGLKEFNLPKVLTLLQQAQEIILGDRPLPPDSSSLEVFGDSLSEEEYEEASDRIDTALVSLEEDFYECEDDIWGALCRFADEHQLTPRSK